MRRLSQLSEWRAAAEAARAAGRRVGLVPTMGALHEGHASLVREATSRGDVVFLSVFVNERQFNDAADLARYPRTPEADAQMAAALGVDVLLEPSRDVMWPDGPATATTVSLGALGEVLEGADRPGHFDGVASVVSKLFVVSGPCRAYFGEKDYQQLVGVRQLVRDLGFDVEVIGCPIVRESDGLALSSRNVRLSSRGRRQARALSAALAAAAETPGPASELRERMRASLEAAGVHVAYAEVVDPVHLRALSDHESGVARALLAGWVEGVRLIDNAEVRVEGVRGAAGD